MKLFAQAVNRISGILLGLRRQPSGSSSDSGTVKMLTDEDYKRIGVKETGPQ